MTRKPERVNKQIYDPVLGSCEVRFPIASPLVPFEGRVTVEFRMYDDLFDFSATYIDRNENGLAFDSALEELRAWKPVMTDEGNLRRYRDSCSQAKGMFVQLGFLSPEVGSLAEIVRLEYITPIGPSRCWLHFVCHGVPNHEVMVTVKIDGEIDFVGVR